MEATPSKLLQGEMKRLLIKRLLKQCTKEQIRVFNKMYESADKISEDKMPWAIEQIELTLKNNDEDYYNKLSRKVRK